MRSSTLYSAAILFLLTLICSCKKENDSTDQQTVNVTIHSNESYKYDLGIFGDEEGAAITRQAMHYQISSAQRSLDFSKVFYEYKPSLNYTGTDVVELKSARGSDGASANNKIIVTTIKFTISN